jgi:hypothetical protein
MPSAFSALKIASVKQLLLIRKEEFRFSETEKWYDPADEVLELVGSNRLRDVRDGISRVTVLDRTI